MGRNHRGREEHNVFDGQWRTSIDKGVTPIGNGLTRLGVTPDQLTALGLVMAMADERGKKEARNDSTKPFISNHLHNAFINETVIYFSARSRRYYNRAPSVAAYPGSLRDLCANC